MQSSKNDGQQYEGNSSSNNGFPQAKTIVVKDLDQDAHNIIGDWEVKYGITTFQKYFRGMITRKRIVKLFPSTIILNTGGSDVYKKKKCQIVSSRPWQCSVGLRVPR